MEYADRNDKTEEFNKKYSKICNEQSKLISEEHRLINENKQEQGDGEYLECGINLRTKRQIFFVEKKIIYRINIIN
jgi:hypothetical protein